MLVLLLPDGVLLMENLDNRFGSPVRGLTYPYGDSRMVGSYRTHFRYRVFGSQVK